MELRNTIHDHNIGKAIKYYTKMMYISAMLFSSSNTTNSGSIVNINNNNISNNCNMIGIIDNCSVIELDCEYNVIRYDSSAGDYLFEYTDSNVQ